MQSCYVRCCAATLRDAELYSSLDRAETHNGVGTHVGDGDGDGDGVGCWCSVDDVCAIRLRLALRLAETKEAPDAVTGSDLRR